MFELYTAVGAMNDAGVGPIRQLLTTQPENPYRYSLKWDGEWQVTYETFRDMGIAYLFGMVLI
jgi:multidrug efflux pump subunit AcrB